MSTLHGFPGLEQINQFRNNLFNDSHSGDSAADNFACWMGHKPLSAICLPANIAGVCIGAAGMVATACTLGAFKVAVFAATLGNVKPEFSIGFLWCAESAAHSAGHIAYNLGELIYDAGNTLYLGYRLVRWVGEKLHLGGFFNQIFRAIGDCFMFVAEQIISPFFNFIGRRIGAGIDKAMECEGNVDFTGKTPSLIKPLDDAAKETRIDWNLDERPLSTIFKHYAISAANIPVNACVAVCAAAASVILSSAFVAKIALYSATNVNIEIPTFAGQAIHATVVSSANVALDAATDAGDSFVLIYKTSRALGINKVVVTALQVLMYIPTAIFT